MLISKHTRSNISHPSIFRSSAPHDEIINIPGESISDLSNDSEYPFDTGNKDILDNRKIFLGEGVANKIDKSLDPKFLLGIGKHTTSKLCVESCTGILNQYESIHTYERRIEQDHKDGGESESWKKFKGVSSPLKASLENCQTGEKIQGGRSSQESPSLLLRSKQGSQPRKGINCFIRTINEDYRFSEQSKDNLDKSFIRESSKISESLLNYKPIKTLNNKDRFGRRATIEKKNDASMVLEGMEYFENPTKQEINFRYELLEPSNSQNGKTIDCGALIEKSKPRKIPIRSGMNYIVDRICLKKVCFEQRNIPNQTQNKNINSRSAIASCLTLKSPIQRALPMKITQLEINQNRSLEAPAIIKGDKSLF